MSPDIEEELLRLIDALCEGQASPDDVARLEELVLSGPGPRRLYVEAMALHGELHWDAGGAGSVPAEALIRPAARDEFPPARPTAMRRYGTAVIAVLIAAAITWLSPDEPQVARNAAPPPARPEPRPAVPAGDPVDQDVPEIQLSFSPANPPREEPLPEIDDRPPPAVRLSARSDREVIAFIDEQLQRSWDENRTAPAPRADDALWVRRVYLDLAGRIPTSREASEFLDDPGDGKRERLVDALLASPDSARHLANVWANLLVGRSRNGEIDRNRLLGWLQQGFAANRPWRETVAQLVTARGSGQDSGPANFLLAHLNNEAVPATAVTARILLCEQLQCTQCHQHPEVRDWGQERFWQLNAFFQQVSVNERMQVDAKTGKRQRVRELVDTAAFGPTHYETLRGVMLVAYPRYGDVEYTTDPRVPLRDRLAQLLVEGDQDQLARAFVNRSWSLLFGRGFTTPVDDMGPHNPPSHPELLAGLGEAFADGGYDVRRLYRWLCLSQAYQLSDQGAADGAPSLELDLPLFERMAARPLSAEQLFDSLLIAQGLPPGQLGSRAVMARRDAWLKQFFTAVDTEENSETTTLDGSVPQALMMMNGELVQQAIDPETGTVLAEILAQPGLSDVERIRRLSLAARARYPDPDELSKIRQLLRAQTRQAADRQLPPRLAFNEGLRDLYWALLNSSEFAVNR